MPYIVLISSLNAGGVPLGGGGYYCNPLLGYQAHGSFNFPKATEEFQMFVSKLSCLQGVSFQFPCCFPAAGM